MKDYECLCGKYKRLKHRGVICENAASRSPWPRCAASAWAISSWRACRPYLVPEITALAHRPVAGYMTLRDIERVLYFESYVVTDPGMTTLEQGQLLSDEQYYEAMEGVRRRIFRQDGRRGDPGPAGAADLEHEIATLRGNSGTNSETKIKKLSKRLKLMEAFPARQQARVDGVACLPVLPPDLRPLVPLDGGRFATSDLNDLYRRVINRNNRLKRCWT